MAAPKETGRPGNVDLTGYSLTDTFGNKTKYRVPAGYSVPAGGFLHVWADEDHNSQNSTNSADLHVNFRLALGGDAIGLYSPSGETVDEVTFGQQTNDVSQGRWPDGAANLYYMSTPTPRAPAQGHGKGVLILTHEAAKATLPAWPAS
jgi:hypothetical protein